MSALEAHDVYGIGAEAETARLFHAHSEEILAFCRRQLGSSTDADDALQTTFLYVLRALRRGVVPEHEAAWLTTIAKNACHTQRRTLGRRGSLTTDVDLDQIALARPEPDEAELIAALPAALAALPDNQRTAIVMREWHGLAPGEIASRLELTTTATNALLTRARRSLATALTATVRGPLSALNVGVLADMLRVYLKSLLGSATAKTAVVAVAATVSVGGVVAQQSLGDSPARGGPQARPSTISRHPPPRRSRGRGRRTRSAWSASRRLPAGLHARRSTKVAASSRPPVAPNADPTHAAAPVAPLQPYRPTSPDATPPKTLDETGAAPEAPAPNPAPIPELPLPELGSGEPLIPPLELPPASAIAGATARSGSSAAAASASPLASRYSSTRVTGIPAIWPGTWSSSPSSSQLASSPVRSTRRMRSGLCSAMASRTA